MGKTGVCLKPSLKSWFSYSRKEMKKWKERKLTQPCGTFRLHQRSGKLRKPSKIPTAHQRLSVHTTWHSQNSREAVDAFGKFSDYAQRWLGYFYHVLHIGSHFCDWHGQECTSQMGPGKVSVPFYFLFLPSVDTVVSQDCLLKIRGCFVPSFFLVMLSEVMGSL